VFYAKAGDFNGDGYDDLLLSASTGSAQATFRIATANDVNNPQAGFKFGPTFTFNPYGVRDLAVGDFNGDGISDFASSFIDPSNRLYAATFSVDPTTLTISNGGQVQLGTTADAAYHPITMTSGRFTAAQHDQLIVGSQLQDGQNLIMQAIDFSGGNKLPDSIVPKLVYSNTPGTNPGSGITFKLKAARVNPAGAADQLIFMSSALIGQTTLKVITVDPAFNPGNPNFFSVNPNGGSVIIPNGDDGVFWGHDFAIGNFDHQQPSPTDPNTTEKNPKLQIAVAATQVNYVQGDTSSCADCSTGFIWIYNVDPVALNLNQISAGTGIPSSNFLVLGHNFNGRFAAYNAVSNMTVSAGDLRGRSYRVGQPTKITLQKAQPSVILAAPPMHADFVTAATGSTGLLNLSVIPEGFYSRYELDTTKSTTSSNTNSLSTSFGIKLTAGAAIAIGDEDAGDGATIKDTATTTADLKTSAETRNGSFSTTEFSINQQTGLTRSTLDQGFLVLRLLLSSDRTHRVSCDQSRLCDRGSKATDLPGFRARSVRDQDAAGQQPRVVSAAVGVRQHFLLPGELRAVAGLSADHAEALGRCGLLHRRQQHPGQECVEHRHEFQPDGVIRSELLRGKRPFVFRDRGPRGARYGQCQWLI
jgi:hypothetical protein